ncbi:hypothetical protein M413DRAFT_442297 [Hebeloma cylindrosporum]|uniref:Transmembrane protein n=1 Tax=Hebeloma cylindrosporum TaxID=76867 RepID=A0A0C2YXH6_HEBCY|nr:hypothetical protein M413DRAFT_442297 [Hebeloma cylindrosporum h7]
MANFTVDDNDPQIHYSGGLWEVLRGSSQQYQGTVHSTWDFNATATFSFDGIGVRVYATIPSGTGTSVVDYSLDAGSSLRVWQTSGSAPVYGKEVFYSGLLPLRTHTLVMSNMGEDDDMDFELDRIVVELEGSSGASATSSSLSIASTQTPITTTTSSSSATSSKSSPVPKIVGSVIGALAFFCILVFVFFRYRRSERKAALSQQVDETPTPFYPQRQKSSPPSALPLTPYVPGASSATSEPEPSSNLTQSATASSQVSPPLVNVTTLGPNSLPQNRPMQLPSSSLPEKTPLDASQPFTAAIPSHPSAHSTIPSSFYQDIDDDRPPAYNPDPR